MFLVFEGSKFLLKSPTCKITKYCHIPTLLLEVAFVVSSHFGPKKEVKCNNDPVSCTEINCVDGTK